MRQTGIPIVGEAPWGTHLCQFYRTREDLLSTLVPYFCAGLENNEYCLWIASHDLTAADALRAMRAAAPDTDRRLRAGQLEILDRSQWYLTGGVFEPKRVLIGWLNKLRSALIRGYDGLRAAGSASGLGKKDWHLCMEYEEAINNRIGQYRMLGLCTYPLRECGSLEVVDVTRSHGLALFPRGDGWRAV